MEKTEIKTRVEVDGKHLHLWVDSDGALNIEGSDEVLKIPNDHAWVVLRDMKNKVDYHKDIKDREKEWYGRFVKWMKNGN